MPPRHQHQAWVGLSGPNNFNHPNYGFPCSHPITIIAEYFASCSPTPPMAFSATAIQFSKPAKLSAAAEQAYRRYSPLLFPDFCLPRARSGPGERVLLATRKIGGRSKFAWPALRALETTKNAEVVWGPAICLECTGRIQGHLELSLCTSCNGAVKTPGRRMILGRD